MIFTNEQEWYLVVDLAADWNITHTTFQRKIALLAATGDIKTRKSPIDHRFVEVHRDSIARLREALLQKRKTRKIAMVV